MGRKAARCGRSDPTRSTEGSLRLRRPTGSGSERHPAAGTEKIGDRVQRPHNSFARRDRGGTSPGEAGRRPAGFCATSRRCARLRRADQQVTSTAALIAAVGAEDARASTRTSCSARVALRESSHEPAEIGHQAVLDSPSRAGRHTGVLPRRPSPDAHRLMILLFPVMALDARDLVSIPLPSGSRSSRCRSAR